VFVLASYITKERVISFNQQVTAKYNQPHVVLQEATIDHYLERVKHYAENIPDVKERLFRKAAYLLLHLAQDAHAFSDGNKRTAYLSVGYFLFLNSYSFGLDLSEQEEGARTMREIAKGNMSITAITAWLMAHSSFIAADSP
jgi:death-on-curing protein